MQTLQSTMDLNESITIPSDLFFSAAIFQNTSAHLQLMTSQDGTNWSTTTNILPSVAASNPVITTFKRCLYLAYQPWNGKVVGQLYLASSFDGVSWQTNPTNIAPNIGGSRCTMFGHLGKLYIVYQEMNTARLCMISSADGFTWSQWVYVSNFASATCPAATVEGNTVYLVFQSTSSHQLMLTTSSNMTTWTSPSVLCNGAQACNPSIAAFGGELHLAYQPWAGKVVGQLYYGYYGAGMNWQYSPSSIVPNIGGFPPAISVSGSSVYILYQEMNTGRLCCVSMPNGGTWSAPEYISNYVTVTAPAFCGIPYAYEIGRRLQQQDIIVKPGPGITLSSADLNTLENPSTLKYLPPYPDSVTNWTGKKNQDPWGFTGVIAWRQTKTQTTTLAPGTIVIFPGTLIGLKDPTPAMYTGASMVNGHTETPIIRQRGSRPPTPTLHWQLCNLLKPSDISLEDYVPNFLGFGIDPPTGANASWELGYRSVSLNAKYFYSEETMERSPMMSQEWREWLSAACKELFTGIYIP